MDSWFILPKKGHWLQNLVVSTLGTTTDRPPSNLAGRGCPCKGAMEASRLLSEWVRQVSRAVWAAALRQFLDPDIAKEDLGAVVAVGV